MGKKIIITAESNPTLFEWCWLKVYTIEKNNYGFLFSLSYDTQEMHIQKLNYHYESLLSFNHDYLEPHNGFFNEETITFDSKEDLLSFIMCNEVVQ